jgi:hypothetical protein
MFEALVAPLPTNPPPIQQPVWQLPLLQTWPVLQVVPLAAADHPVASFADWHV